MEAKEDRNWNIQEYHRTHPTTSIRAIGRMFKISHVRVLQILNRKPPVITIGGMSPTEKEIRRILAKGAAKKLDAELTIDATKGE